jgi:hypothetical protein
MKGYPRASLEALRREVSSEIVLHVFGAITTDHFFPKLCFQLWCRLARYLPRTVENFPMN